MRIAVPGIDPGENSCGVAGLDAAGRVVLRRRLGRDGVIKLAAGLPRRAVATEARCGAHHLGRVLRDQGHRVRPMSPEYVRPHAKALKNDDRDAEATAEAATRPTMRLVDLKSETQLDLRSLTRARCRRADLRPRRLARPGRDQPRRPDDLSAPTLRAVPVPLRRATLPEGGRGDRRRAPRPAGSRR